MYIRNPYDRYRNQDIDTSSNYELVGRFYGEAALCLNKAVGYIGEQKYDKANSDIIKAQKIISGLNGALDMNYEISGNLRALYSYMLRVTFKANLKKNAKTIGNVAQMLSELRDTWDEAVKKFKMTQA